MPPSSVLQSGTRAEGPQDGDPFPLVSIIVPIYNEKGRIGELVESIRNQEYPGEFELIIVDNGSTDGTKGTLEELGVDYLAEPKAGSYAARNRGVTEAEGDIFAFTDGDCRPDPDWIYQAVLHLLEGDADMVAGDVRMVPDGSWGLWERYDAAVYLQQRYDVKNGQAATANLVVKKRVFEEMSPFPEVMSGGDFSWTKRATSSGYSLAYAPSAVVSHPTRSFRQALARQTRFVKEHGIASIFHSTGRAEVMGKLRVSRGASIRTYLAAIGFIAMKNFLDFMAAFVVLFRR